MNIENKGELMDYLQMHQHMNLHDDDNFEILRGGVSNRTIRYDGSVSLVIKQALPKLRTEVDWFSDPERLRVEARALDWLNSFLPGGTTPAKIFYDEAHYILGMEAIPLPHKNLKEVLLQGIADVKLIEQMGKILRQLHRKGMNDSDARDQFNTRSYFKNLRIEPYYEFTASKLPDIKSFFDQLIKETLSESVTIVHGDFSPKNILVKEDRQLVLLDHEVMHLGDPAFDVGFFLTHLLSKANHLNLLGFVEVAMRWWNTYATDLPFVDTGYQERCVRHLQACLLARVYGRSPLEYLNESQKDWQVRIILDLIAMEIPDISTFLGIFEDHLRNRTYES